MRYVAIEQSSFVKSKEEMMMCWSSRIARTSIPEPSSLSIAATAAMIGACGARAVCMCCSVHQALPTHPSPEGGSVRSHKMEKETKVANIPAKTTASPPPRPPSSFARYPTDRRRMPGTTVQWCDSKTLPAAVPIGSNPAAVGAWHRAHKYS